MHHPQSEEEFEKQKEIIVRIIESYNGKLEYYGTVLRESPDNEYASRQYSGLLESLNRCVEALEETERLHKEFRNDIRNGKRAMNTWLESRKQKD